ncbi:MAG: hypothetical protein JWM68_4385 [Verrucomicrobiales bacterium]|nr:hypothetical protein [Verrucomicrobiales bacterium]
MKKQISGFAMFYVVILSIVLASPFASRAATNVVDTETKLLASDARTELIFGNAVAIDGSSAAVAAGEFGRGTVYTFDLVGGVWTETQKINVPITLPFDQFGNSIALESNTLAIGQPLAFASSNLSGQVYVYVRSGSTWVLQATLLEPVLRTEPFIQMGNSVSLSGNTLVAGDLNNSSAATSAGAVFVYQRTGTNWAFVTELFPNLPLEFERIGASVAIDRDTIIAGTLSDATNVPGAAYVFVRSGTNWIQQQILLLNDVQLSVHSIVTVAIEGNIAVLGLPEEVIGGVNSGAAYVFVRIGSTWTLQQKLVPTNAEANLGFGTDVAIQNGQVVVGLPGRTVNGLALAGAFDLFRFNGSSWVLAQEVSATDARADARFGSALDLDSSNIISGAGFDSEAAVRAGAAYIYALTPSNETFTANASPNVLFPPNHKLVPITIMVSHPESFASCRIVSVTSNEPITGKRRGNIQPDFVITGDLSLLLRAERSGKKGQSRIYNIEIQCTDANGGTTSTTVIVTVPHDEGKVIVKPKPKALASDTSKTVPAKVSELLKSNAAVGKKSRP